MRKLPSEYTREEPASRQQHEQEALQKNLDYVATPQSTRPPRVPGSDIEAPQGSSSNDPSFMEIATTAISWENPLLSGILTIAGVFVAILGDYLLKGKHGVPLLSGKSYPSTKPDLSNSRIRTCSHWYP